MTCKHNLKHKHKPIKQIQLTSKNMCIAYVKDSTPLTVLCDTGSSTDLISMRAVKMSPYLSSLKMEDIKPLSFSVAGGTKVLVDKKLEFTITIQNVDFNINAFAMPDCGPVSILLGAETLNKLRAKIDFTNNILTIKHKRLPIMTSGKRIIKPGAIMNLNLFGKLPKHLRNVSMVIHFNNFFSDLTVPSALISFRNGKCCVPIVNKTKRLLRIRKNSVIGVVDTHDTLELLRPLQVQKETIENFQKQMSPVGIYTISTSNDETIDRKLLCKHKIKKYKHLDSDDPRLCMTDEEIIDAQIDLKPGETLLSPDQIKEFREMLYKNKEAFSLHDEIGKTDHVIDLKLKYDKPFFIRPLSVSEADKVLIDKHVDKLVHLGILTPGMATHSSPIMLIDKKGQKQKRFVSDLRILNRALHPLNYPFPLIRDSLQTLGASGSTIFSTMDIKEAFHSINLSKSSQDLCGLTTYPSGRSFRYLKMPMGLCQSSQRFSEFMEKILATIPNASKFILSHTDDVLIHSRNISDHRKNLQTFFDAMIKFGLKLSPKKSKFFKDTLIYMGHLITVKDGQPHVMIVKSRIEAVDRIKTPRTPKELKSYIGAINYLSMFLPKLSELLKPLYHLTKKNVKFEWTDLHQQNFDRIKELIKSAPLLATPTRFGKYKLLCDTSRTSVGAALSQLQNNKEKLIGYYSKSLPASAANYSVTELEAYGLIQAIKAFQNLLKGNHFEAIVDHSALVHMVRSKSEPATRRLQKFVDHLSGYSYDLKFMKGLDLTLPDFLSRSCTPEDNHGISNDILSEITKLSDSDRKKLQGSPLSLICTTDHKTPNLQNSTSITEFPSVLENNVYMGEKSSITASDMAPARITRSYAKKHNIDVTPDYYNTPDQRKRSSVKAAKGQKQDDSHPKQSEQFESNVIPPTESDTTPPLQHFSDSFPGQHPMSSVSKGNLNLKPPSDNLDLERPSLVKISQNHIKNTDSFTEKLALQRLNNPNNTEVSEVKSYTQDIPKYLYRKDRPILPNLQQEDIVLKQYPKQSDTDKILDSITKRAIRDFNLPISYTEMKQEQQRCPIFKDIYAYLSCGLLPSVKSKRNSIRRQSENYLLANGILFKIDYVNNGEDFKMTLCVPEKFVPVLIDKHHSEIHCSHQGIRKTFLCIRRYYYCHNLFDKICDYIRSCIICQQRKDQSPNAKHRQPVARIFHDYEPFSEIHMDIKSLYRSFDGFSLLLVAIDPLTRFMTAVPLRRQDSASVSEAILQRIVFQYGVPKKIVSDLGSAFCSSVLLHIYKTLGISAKYVSPYSHQSNISEKAIDILSKLLVSHLKGTGRNWTAYVAPCVYAYNSFPLSILNNKSPYELLYARPPKDIAGLHMSNLPNIPVTYKEYLENLKNKFQVMGRIVLDLHNNKQIAKVYENEDKVMPKHKFVVGQLVYFLCPNVGALQTGTLKFKASYTGPLQIAALPDPNHVILKDLRNNLLYGVHGVRRIKAAYIKIPGGIASTMSELKKGYNLPDNTNVDIKSLKLVDENGKQVESFGDKHSLFLIYNDSDTTEVQDLNPMLSNAKHNVFMMTPIALNNEQMTKLEKHSYDLPAQGSILEMTKARLKDNQLQILLRNKHGFHIWLHVYTCPYLFKDLDMVYEKLKTLKITGKIKFKNI